MIHLDTNFLIQALVAGSVPEAKLVDWLAAGEQVGISTIAWSEFLCGPLADQDELLARAFLMAPEAFHVQDARRAAELFNLTGRRTRSLADCQIAAVALRVGARVATINVADFAPLQAYGLVFAQSPSRAEYWMRESGLLARQGRAPHLPHAHLSLILIVDRGLVAFARFRRRPCYRRLR